MPLPLRACDHRAIPDRGALAGLLRAARAALVVYRLGRQHLPGRWVAETLADCLGLPISTGTVDAICSEASRRLKGFIAPLVTLLKTLPVLHVDETSDRVGTKTCWMHVAYCRAPSAGTG